MGDANGMVIETGYASSLVYHGEMISAKFCFCFWVQPPIDKSPDRPGVNSRTVAAQARRLQER